MIAFTRFLMVATVMFAATVSSALAQTEGAAPAASASKLFNLNYAGGTVRTYIEALKKVAPDANITASPDSLEVAVPPLELKQVSVAAALGLLRNRMVDAQGSQIVMQVEQAPITTTGESPVFVISAQIRPSKQTMMTNRVWSIATHHHWGIKREDMLTAIQTSLDMIEGPKAQLRLHEATGIMIARGTPEQLDAIQQVLSALEEAAAGGYGEAASAQENDEDPRDETIKHLQQKIKDLEAQLAASRPKQ